MKLKKLIGAFSVAALLTLGGAGEAKATCCTAKDAGAAGTLNTDIVLTDNVATGDAQGQTGATKNASIAFGILMGICTVGALAVGGREIYNDIKSQKEDEKEFEKSRKFFEDIIQKNQAAVAASKDTTAKTQTLIPAEIPGAVASRAEMVKAESPFKSLFRAGDKVKIKCEGREGIVKGVHGEVTSVKIDGKNYKYRTDDLAKLGFIR